MGPSGKVFKEDMGSNVRISVARAFSADVSELAFSFSRDHQRYYRPTRDKS